jgi:hypothetical protein
MNVPTCTRAATKPGIRLLHLQSIDECGDAGGVDCQQPDRDHEPGDGASRPRDSERGTQPFARMSKSAGRHEQHNREEDRLVAAIGNPVGGRGRRRRSLGLRKPQKSVEARYSRHSQLTTMSSV